MTKNAYMYLSIVLGIIVIGLLIYIFTRPKPVDTATLQADLSQFSMELAQWNATNGASSTPQSRQQLSNDLSNLSQQLQSYR